MVQDGDIVTAVCYRIAANPKTLSDFQGHSFDNLYSPTSGIDVQYN